MHSISITRPPKLNTGPNGVPAFWRTLIPRSLAPPTASALEAGVAWPATPAVAAFVALVAFVAFAAESALAALGTLPSDDSLTSAPLTLSFAEVRAGHLTVADV